MFGDVKTEQEGESVATGVELHRETDQQDDQLLIDSDEQGEGSRGAGG